jgi:L-alanine-DL-glutamate epimerase-like enolase superfamily enzyme
VIKFVKGKEYQEKHLTELVDALKKVFGEPVTIRVDFVDEIKTNSIKRKAIESRVGKKQVG